MALVTCAWCNTSYSNFQPNCSNCGGPLPSPPGADPGPKPPAAPRELPPGYIKKRVFSDASLMIGAIFSFIAILLFTVFFTISLSTGMMAFLGASALILIIFGGVGGFLFYFSFKKLRGRIRAFREGLSVQGQVTEIYTDHSVQINGRSPFCLEYRFNVGGVNYEGKVNSFDSSILARQPGQPIHILYVEDNPKMNSIYPPLR